MHCCDNVVHSLNAYIPIPYLVGPSCFLSSEDLSIVLYSKHLSKSIFCIFGEITLLRRLHVPTYVKQVIIGPGIKLKNKMDTAIQVYFRLYI